MRRLTVSELLTAVQIAAPECYSHGLCVSGSHCPRLAVTEWRMVLVSIVAFRFIGLNE